MIALITVICSVKMIRNGFASTQNQYTTVFLTYLLFKYDFKKYSEHFLLDYFFMSILFLRVGMIFYFFKRILTQSQTKQFQDFLLKLNFVFTYIAPWQITWGSAFHAFAQPFSVPRELNQLNIITKSTYFFLALLY